jgi:GNAT superfamily N-acetyltransferase
MTENEFNYLAKDLKMILDPDFCLVAEKDNKLVGFILGIPDINQILIKIKKGRLLPTGIFKLLFGKKNIKNLRVLTLGVVEEYRKLGIEGCLYGRVIKNGRAKGIVKAECSWMLEDNYMINHAIEQINGKVYKRYRLYEKAI